MLKKTCPKCGKLIDYSSRYCEGCSKLVSKDKKISDKYYDTNIRDKESYNVYHDKRWIKLTEECKQRFSGLDVYEYYINHNIIYGSLSHHIIKVKEDSSKIYDLENLIYASSKTHKMIHAQYDKGKESKEKMQRLLLELVIKWKKEFKN